MLSTKRSFGALINKAIPVGLGLTCLFLGQALLARLMGPEIFGSYSYLIAWLMAAAILAKAGHEWVILKAVPRQISQGKTSEIRFLAARVVTAVAIRATFSAFLLGAGVFLFARNLPITLSEMIAGGLLILVLAIVEIRRALALSYGSVWLAEAPENIIKSVLLAVVAVLFVTYSEITTEKMLWSNLLITVLSSALAVALFLKYRAPDLFEALGTPVETEAHDDLMRSMWVATALNLVLRYADIFVIGAITDPASTGVYIVATRIAYLASAPVMILDRIVAAPISEAAGRRDTIRLRGSSWEYAVLSTIGCGLLVFFMVVWGSQFILLLFGSGYDDALAITWILLIGHIANAVTGPTGVLLSMTGSHRILVAIAGISAGIYLTLLYYLTLDYLLIGAASAFAATHASKAILQVFFIHRRLGINPTVFGLPR